jgi:hypothetical protein
MSCTSCQQTTATITGYNPASCQTCASGTCSIDASCIIYTGPNLPCSSIITNDAMDVALQKIDALLCASTGDYSSYNVGCLAPISTQQQFVESISAFTCTLSTSFNTFVTTTFSNYQASVATQIAAINSPQITCAIAGVTTADSLTSILNKYCSTMSSISSSISLSGVNWSSCYTVSPTPTTVAQGFSVLIGQICLLKAAVSGGAVLPIFNNTGTCLSGGTNADSLVTTINLLKTQVCQTGILNVTSLSWGCATQPSNNPTDLQGSLQSILNQLTTVSQATPFAWSSDFTVTLVDPSNACLGKRVALAVPSAQDRFVAASPSDVSPGTLQEKVTAGTNVTLDFITLPGQMIINSTGGAGNNKVLADSTDSTPDYLLNKLESGTASLGIQVSPVLDTTNPNHIVALNVTVDPVALLTGLLQAAQGNSGLLQTLCYTVGLCPSPCSAPTNVTVIYQAGGTTTTTTSSTTTTTTTT